MNHQRNFFRGDRFQVKGGRWRSDHQGFTRSIGWSGGRARLQLVMGCCLLVYSVLAVRLPLASADDQPVQRKDRPNVIVVLTDDQGWGDLSINGNTNLSTPNIDRLSSQGVSFDRFFVCPVCSPTRAEFLTGRYHVRSGVYSTSAGGERMNLDEVTIADMFQSAGYRTGAFGKWHNGMQYPYHPNGRGFDEYYGFCSGHWGNYFSPVLERNGKIVKGNGFVVDDFTNQLLEFVEENKDRPFFAYLPLNTPHSPMQVPDQWWNRFRSKELQMRHRDPKKENIPHTRAALAMCENIDWNVGRIMAKLNQMDLAKETIFVYFCDNGPNGSRWNGGMKGRKGSTDEGGVRSPLFIRWPGKIRSGSTFLTVSSVVDLLPTLAGLCDVRLTNQQPLDGLNLADQLQGKSAVAPSKRVIFNHWKGRLSVRTQRYRLDQKGALYDMVVDPHQRVDVSGDHPEIAKQLREAAKEFQNNVARGYDQDSRPFVVGHRDSLLTQVPARDGKAKGNIRRSNRFPNCSFFTNWKSVDDQISWDVSIGKTGQYEVVLYYTCAPEDVGTVVNLSFGDKSISKKISTAYHPPELGAADDRVKRMESYVKNFKPISMGIIDLKKGPGQLVLRASEIPGKQSIDFRMMMFERR
jgi:arylsulfatase A-like enzyme